VGAYLRIEFADAALVHQFGDMSCEMIAMDLLTKFGLEMVKVEEDGENGAKVMKLTGRPRCDESSTQIKIKFP